MAVYEHDESKRIVARVQKMLRLAADAGAAEGERDTAMRMAHALLAKHNLDLHAVSSSTPANETAASSEPRVDTSAEFDGWVWARSACQSIGELFFCHYLYAKTGKSSRSCRHYFIGRVSNSTTAALVAEFVVEAIYREARRAAQRANAESTSEFIRSFGWGAALRIKERVQELRRAPTPAPTVPGTSLVLANVYDTEARANQQYLATRFGSSVRRGSGGRRTANTSALAEGRAYGANVSLNAQVR